MQKKPGGLVEFKEEIVGGVFPRSNLRNFDIEEPGGPLEFEEKLWEEFFPGVEKIWSQLIKVEYSESI